MKSPGSRGLSWNTIQRLHDLEAAREYLKHTTDIFEQLPNIEALLKAYRSGQLEWHVGFVTYWSGGLQICQPRRFDWDEFEAINSRHLGHKGFWTEGVIKFGYVPNFNSLMNNISLPDLHPRAAMSESQQIEP